MPKSKLPETGPPGLAHDSPRTPNVHISGPQRFKTPTKFFERIPREGKKNENCGRRARKSEILGPHLSELHPRGLHPPLIEPHPVGGPKIQHPKIGRSRNWPKSIVVQSLELWAAIVSPLLFNLLVNGLAAAVGRSAPGAQFFAHRGSLPLESGTKLEQNGPQREAQCRTHLDGEHPKSCTN